MAAALMNFRLYIADGHHRFQTSVEYRNECLAQGWRTSGPESFDKRMIGLFNMESPGLKVLATHRGIKNVDDSRIGRVRAGLEPFFQLDGVSSAEELTSLLEGERTPVGSCPQWFEPGLSAPAPRSGLFPTRPSCRPSRDRLVHWT